MQSSKIPVFIKESSNEESTAFTDNHTLVNFSAGQKSTLIDKHFGKDSANAL